MYIVLIGDSVYLTLIIFSLLRLSVVSIIVIYYPLIIFIYIFKYYFYFTQKPEINLLKPGTNLGPFFKTRSH